MNMDNQNLSTPDREHAAHVADLAGDYPEILAAAVSEWWPIEKVRDAVREAKAERLAKIRAERPTLEMTAKGARGPDDGSVRQAQWLAAIGKGDVAERQLGKDVVLAAAARGRVRPIEILAADLQAIGRTPPRGDDAIFAAYKQAQLQGAWSNNGAVAVTDRSIETIALDRIALSEEPWRRMAARRPLPDFKESQIARLAGTFEFDIIPRGGEIPHGQLGADSTPIQLATYGLMVTIERQSVINDSMGLCASVPTELAVEGARKIGEHVYSLLADEGGTFFTEDRGNLMTGTDTALSIEALAYAATRLRKATDRAGRVLNIPPRYLLVSAELEAPARAILNSEEIQAAEAGATGNPMKGIAELLVDARLQSTEWFLMAGPEFAPIVVATYNGADAPIVETVDPGPNVLGVGWRAYYDYGVALHEYRAIVKATGQSA